MCQRCAGIKARNLLIIDSEMKQSDITHATTGERIAKVLETVLPHERPIALHEPHLGLPEREAVAACIDSGFVSSVGAYVDEFEERLAAITGARRAIAVVNGTAALQIALTLAGVEPGDEVLVPALTFVGTANAVVHAGATPHFVDCDEATFGMSSTAVHEHLERIAKPSPRGPINRETGARIAAMVPMHAFGHPADMPALMTVADALGLPIVEDAAESLGSTLGGKHTGTFGQLGIVSFNGNKVVTTGGGGAILTDDDDLADRAKHLTTTAKVPHRWDFVHDQVAWNFRMPNLNAALGCAQLERLPELLHAKRHLAAAYALAFESVEEIEFTSEPEGTRSNYWLCTIRTHATKQEALSTILDHLNDAGYGCRPAWRLLHHLPMFSGAPRAEVPIAENLEREIVCLPSSAQLAPSMQR